MKYFQFFNKSVIKRRNNQPYLIRWTIIGFGIDSSWFSIKVHNILISDEECLHNHPWTFISIILLGGYREHTQALPWAYRPAPTWSPAIFNDKNGFKIQNREFRRGSILFRPAHWSHRLELFTKLIPKGHNGPAVEQTIPAWTLVFTFRKVQRWGFFTRQGWIPNWKYNEEKDC